MSIQGETQDNNFYAHELITVSANKWQGWQQGSNLVTVLASAANIDPNIDKLKLPIVCFNGLFTESDTRKGTVPVKSSGLIFFDIDHEATDELMGAVRSLEHVVAVWKSFSGRVHGVAAVDSRTKDPTIHKATAKCLFDWINSKLDDHIGCDYSVASINNIAFLPYIPAGTVTINEDATPFKVPEYAPVDHNGSSHWNNDPLSNAVTAEDYANVIGETGWMAGKNYRCPMGHGGDVHSPKNRQRQFYIGHFPETGHIFVRCVGNNDHSDTFYNFYKWCSYWGKDTKDFIDVEDGRFEFREDDDAPSAEGEWRLELPDAYNLPPLPDALYYSLEGVRVIPEGMYTSVYGGFCTGKSWIALAAAAEALRSGRRVAYFDAESNPRNIAKRLLTIGAYDLAKDRDKFTLVDINKYKRPKNMNKFCREIIDWVGDGLVVLDTIGSLGGHTDSNKEATDFHEKYIQPYTQGGCAVLGLDHDTRGKANRADRAQHGGIGAAAKSNVADVIYHLESQATWNPEKSGHTVLTLRKDKEGITEDMALNTPALVFEMTRDDLGNMIPAMRSKHPKLDLSDNTQKAIIRILKSATRPMKIDEITSDSNFGKTKIRAALKELVDEGMVVKTKAGKADQYELEESEKDARINFAD